jgi:hypothetical protein
VHLETANKVRDILRRMDDINLRISKINDMSRERIYLESERVAKVYIPSSELQQMIVKLILAELQAELDKFKKELESL